jgi:hypothetical protein
MAAVVGALLVGMAAMLVGTAGPASAATTENVAFCDSIWGTYIQAFFPQHGNIGTFDVGPGSCLQYNGFFSAGEPYIIRIYYGNGTVYRDLAGYTIWGCNERVTAVGSYNSPAVAQGCM